MASSSRDKHGNGVIQFIAVDGKRRSVRVGKISDARVEVIRERIEQICVAVKYGHPLDGEVTEWLIRLGDEMHAKLSAVGLVSARGKANLGAFMDGYINGRTDLEERTRKNLRTEAARLVEFFGADKVMRAITPAEADGFVVWMKTQGYAQATTARNIKRARQFFTAAIRGRVASVDPFAHIKPGSMTNDDRQFFVSRDAAMAVIEACPNREWRLIVALSRFGGLRCPSEHQALTWNDIDWARDRFTIRSPKTGDRIVPLFPELLPFLQECFEAAEPGAIHVITSYRERETNLRTTLGKIIERAGLVRWERPFHNMRASRQTELAADFPVHVVCEWLGNTTSVAMQHYLTVREDDYARAVQPKVAAKNGAVTHCTGSIDGHRSIELTTKVDAIPAVKQDFIQETYCTNVNYPRRDSNP